MINTKKTVEIWTDGGCSKNPGPGGLGVLMKYQDKSLEICYFVPYTTNNQMELLAAIVALSKLKEPCNVILHTDSVYLKDGITKWIYNWQKNNWKTSTKKNVKNTLLWKELYKLTKEHEIQFNWLKGHSGIEGNEVADALCNKAMKNKIPILNNNYLELLEQPQ